MNCTEARELLDAYADEELDVVTSRTIDRHLETCGRCRVAIDRIRTIRNAVSDRSQYHRAPADLQDRILNLTKSRTLPRRGGGRPWLWRGLAAAAVIVLAVGTFVLVQGRRDNLEAAILTAHLRALQPDHLLDVVSTDRHTVKPWFDTRLDFSPPVPQLAPRFVLEGGRMDYVQDRPVAALVYRQGGHVINVFIWPGESGVSSSAERGFNMVHWSASRMTFWAVSDLAASDLNDFARLFRGTPLSGSAK